MLHLLLTACLATQSLEDQVGSLKGKLDAIEKARPDAVGPALEAWDRQCYDASWDYGVALFRLAEERKKRDLYTRVVEHFTAFIWKWDDYLAALQARIYLARAHQALMEWGPCFRHLSQARQLATPENRKNPELIEIATRSFTAELRARADFKKGLDGAVQSVQAHLKQFPALLENETFLAVRLELARALHALGRAAESEKTLLGILEKHPEDAPGDTALELLADLVAKEEYVLRWAERLFARHHFTPAAVYFARCTKTPRLWFRLGACFAHSKRPYEAAEALQPSIAADHAERLDAALLLEKILNVIVTTLKDEAFRPRLAAHREWMRKTLDLARAGAAVLRAQADELRREGKLGEAIDLYAKIKPGEEPYPAAVYSIGVCELKRREYEKAVGAFRSYLALKPASTDAAVDLLCWSLLGAGKPEDLLALTEKSAPTDTAVAQARLAHRVDAFARLGRFKEADAELGRIEAPEALVRALRQLALGYEAAIAKTGEKKLWGPYARVVVALTEKTFQPLRGEKLLAAADALSLEETKESFTLALDLYSQYLLSQDLRVDERRAVDYRRALAAIGAGRLDRALEIADALSSGSPENGSYRELRADIQAAQAAGLSAGTERNRKLDQAMEAYGELRIAFRMSQNEHYYRLTEKYARLLFQRDPERCRDFFLGMEKRGYGKWDEGQWGYKAKMDALRAEVLKAVPAKR